MITEISGESGTGKTQFCMQLMLQALLPSKYGGLQGGSYYISTHKSMSETRFEELKESYCLKYPRILKTKEIESSITVTHLTDKNKDELKLYIDDVKRKLEAKENIRLLIIDSITAVCYSFVEEANVTDHFERAKFLLTLVNMIKKLAYQYNLVVVVINNTVGDIEKTQNFGQTNIPALGILWANSINQRIFLTRQHTKAGTKRQMEIMFSPLLSQSKVEFTIIKEGITEHIPS